MRLDNTTGYVAREQAMNQELDYLLQRLSTVNNLIRSLERYEATRPKPKQITKRKLAQPPPQASAQPAINSCRLGGFSANASTRSICTASIGLLSTNRRARSNEITRSGS